MFKLLGLSVAILFSINCNASQETPTARVVAFLINAHTGKEMRAEDWLTKAARSSPAFLGFRGLDALVRQTTERADRFGGLKRVRVLAVKKDGPTYLIDAQVLFVNDHRDASNPVAATNEDMVWRFRVTRESNQWKMAF